jgi:hypothetical protein
MNKSLLEKNAKCIFRADSNMYRKLLAIDSSPQSYLFNTARSGESVPSIIDCNGLAHFLHSGIDPAREAERIAASLFDEKEKACFIVLLGLGGGFIAEAVLQNQWLSNLIIIDYGIKGIAELFGSRDYTKILTDKRCSILIDPQPNEIGVLISQLYLPVICGNIRVYPLRARTMQDSLLFNAAIGAIEHSIQKITSDYSVQAHFGMRWFSNTIQNLKKMDSINSNKMPAGDIHFSALQGFAKREIRELAICAAGPSLDLHIPLLIKILLMSFCNLWLTLSAMVSLVVALSESV